jgi:hypothetical protein
MPDPRTDIRVSMQFASSDVDVDLAAFSAAAAMVVTAGQRLLLLPACNPQQPQQIFAVT